MLAISITRDQADLIRELLGQVESYRWRIEEDAQHELPFHRNKYSEDKKYEELQGLGNRSESLMRHLDAIGTPFARAECLFSRDGRPGC